MRLDQEVLAYVTNRDLMNVFGVNEKVAKKIRKFLHEADNGNSLNLDNWLTGWKFQNIVGVRLGLQKACGAYGCVYFDADTKFGKAAVKVVKDNGKTKIIKVATVAH